MEDIAKLDSAFTNLLTRRPFTDIIGDGHFFLDDQETSSASKRFEWAHLRGIHLTSLCVDYFSNPVFSQDSKLNLSTIEMMKIEPPVAFLSIIQWTDFHQVVVRCPSLRNLILSEFSMPEEINIPMQQQVLDFFLA